jgi:hypothetical protein
LYLPSSSMTPNHRCAACICLPRSSFPECILSFAVSSRFEASKHFRRQPPARRGTIVVSG